MGKKELLFKWLFLLPGLRVSLREHVSLELSNLSQGVQPLPESVGGTQTCRSSLTRPPPPHIQGGWRGEGKCSSREDPHLFSHLLCWAHTALSQGLTHLLSVCPYLTVFVFGPAHHTRKLPGQGLANQHHSSNQRGNSDDAGSLTH